METSDQRHTAYGMCHHKCSYRSACRLGIELVAMKTRQSTGQLASVRSGRTNQRKRKPDHHTVFDCGTWPARGAPLSCCFVRHWSGHICRRETSQTEHGKGQPLDPTGNRATPMCRGPEPRDVRMANKSNNLVRWASSKTPKCGYCWLNTCGKKCRPIGAVLATSS